MSVKYMCDRCEKNEGTHQIQDGSWYCVNCYSGYGDYVYEQHKDEIARATGEKTK